MMTRKSKLATDLLSGHGEIAAFVFGHGASAKRAQTAIKAGLPCWRIGNRIFAKKSSIEKWIEEQESENA
jgi:calcineurin-like phosphoesterase